MYPVSEAYKEAMKSPVQHFKLRGTITNKNMTYFFSEENVLKGSFSISNQCCGSSAMEIGSVYTGELSMTLLNGVVPRYSIYGSTIEVYSSLLTDNGWEEIPLGIFIISEANYSTSGCEITAYDKMSLFDKSLNINTTSADMWTMLNMASEACGVAIGMTEEEVQAFPNGNRVLGMYANNDMETWRDLISWLSQTAGCFATINRAGELIFRAFTQDVVDIIDSAHRFKGCKFSDFVTRYTGLSCVNMGDQTTSYYGALDVEDDGLTMNLGSNPFLQYGVDETVEASRRAVLVAIEVINYVPFSASMIGNPAYDLGDVFRFTDGIADGTCLSCLTKYEWKFNDRYAIEGVGENPALASARSKVDKDISGLLSNSDENKMYYYTFTNADTIRIRAEEKKPVISIVFAAVKSAELEFKAEILCETTAESSSDNTIVEASYMMNGENVTGYYPTETLQDGKHILHLFYPLRAAEGTVNRWVVNLSARFGTLKIDKGQILAMINGQGLAGKDGWDGTIDVSDEVEFDLISMRPRFTSSIAVFTDTKGQTGVSDAMRINLASLFDTFRNNVGASGGIGIVMVEEVLDAEDAGSMTYSHKYVMLSNERFVLRKDYEYYSTEQIIDTGRVVMAEADTNSFASVEGISVGVIS